MKPPAFQFYADDFLAGTVTMSFVQRGFYITLLCIQWNKGFVAPEDVADLIADGTAIAQPLANRVLAKFEKDETGNLRNRRMEVERKKQAIYRENRSDAGRAGAKSRWHSHDSAMAEPMANDGSPSPSPLPTKDIEREKAGSAANYPEVTVPTWDEVKTWAQMDGVPEDVAQAFYDHENSFGQWRAGGRINGMPINGRNALKVWFQRSRQISQKPTPPAKKKIIPPPSREEVEKFVSGKVTDIKQLNGWVGRWFEFWNSKNWKKAGSTLDWQSELTLDIAIHHREKIL